MAIVRKRKRMDVKVPDHGMDVKVSDHVSLILKIVLSRLQDLKTDMRCRCVCTSWYTLVGTLWFDSIDEEWEDSIDDQYYLQSRNVPDMLSQSTKGLGFVSDPITRGYKVVNLSDSSSNSYAVYTYETRSRGKEVTYILIDHPMLSILSPLRRVQLPCRSSGAFVSAVLWRGVLCWRTLDSRVMLWFHHRENKFQVVRRDFTSNVSRKIEQRISKGQQEEEEICSTAESRLVL